MVSQSCSASATVSKGDPAHPDGPVDMDGTPRSCKARPPVKLSTTATLVTDHEREAALARAPDLGCRTNAVEVQRHLNLKQPKKARV